MSAHPEPKSLNGSLRRDGIAQLRSVGHSVIESEVYALGWHPVVRRADAGISEGERSHVTGDVRQAYRERRLPEDVVAEQEKLSRADATNESWCRA